MRAVSQSVRYGGCRRYQRKGVASRGENGEAGRGTLGKLQQVTWGARDAGSFVNYRRQLPFFNTEMHDDCPIVTPGKHRVSQHAAA